MISDIALRRSLHVRDKWKPSVVLRCQQRSSLDNTLCMNKHRGVRDWMTRDNKLERVTPDIRSWSFSREGGTGETFLCRAARDLDRSSIGPHPKAWGTRVNSGGKLYAKNLLEEIASLPKLATALLTGLKISDPTGQARVHFGRGNDLTNSHKTVALAHESWRSCEIASARRTKGSYSLKNHNSVPIATSSTDQ